LKIGYIQTSPIFGEKQANFDRIESLTENVKADLIVLPELFATGYTFISKEEAMGMSEPKEGKSGVFLQKMAKNLGAVVIGGFIEKEKGKIYNSALIVDETGVIDTYRKIHLFNKEKKWFSPGNKPFKVHKVNGMKIGCMICFDWIFPESVRSLALLEAEIIAHPSNLVLPYCQKAMVTRCVSNRVFAVTCNRIGKENRGEDNFNFTGASQITAPNGNLLSSAPIDQESSDIVEIDLEKARNKNLNDFNNLISDRRKNLYFDLP
jgi:predicted amidohydrolase